MKRMKKIVMAIMVIVMMAVIVNPVNADAATKVKLNKTKATLTITDKKKNPTVTLKVKGTSKKAKWTTSDKKVATVKNGKVTAKGAGKATITCKVSGKTLKCKVTVKDKRAGITVILKAETYDEVMARVEQIKNPKKSMQVIGDSHLEVKYNGKDVTSKATFKRKSNEDSDYDRITVNNKGVIGLRNDWDGSEDTTEIVVTYDGMKQTIKLKLHEKRETYDKCGCGAVFYDDDALYNHMKSNALAGNPCGNSYIIPYYVCTFTEAK